MVSGNPRDCAWDPSTHLTTRIQWKWISKVTNESYSRVVHIRLIQWAFHVTD